MRRLLFALLCLLSPALLAHEGMSMDMSKGPELGASAAFDGHGRLYLVDAANGHVRLRHLDDDGRTLSAPVAVKPIAEPIYAEGENRPKIAFGPHDELYVELVAASAPNRGPVLCVSPVRRIAGNISANRLPCTTTAPRSPIVSTHSRWTATAAS